MIISQFSPWQIIYCCELVHLWKSILNSLSYAVSLPLWIVMSVGRCEVLFHSFIWMMTDVAFLVIIAGPPKHHHRENGVLQSMYKNWELSNVHNLLFVWCKNRLSLNSLWGFSFESSNSIGLERKNAWCLLNILFVYLHLLWRFILFQPTKLFSTLLLYYVLILCGVTLYEVFPTWIF